MASFGPHMLFEMSPAVPAFPARVMSQPPDEEDQGNGKEANVDFDRGDMDANLGDHAMELEGELSYSRVLESHSEKDGMLVAAAMDALWKRLKCARGSEIGCDMLVAVGAFEQSLSCDLSS